MLGRAFLRDNISNTSAQQTIPAPQFYHTQSFVKREYFTHTTNLRGLLEWYKKWKAYHITCTLLLSTPQLDNRQLRCWNITFLLHAWLEKLYRSLCYLMPHVLFNFEGSVGSNYRARTIISIYCGLCDLAKIVHTLICLEFGQNAYSFPKISKW